MTSFAFRHIRHEGYAAIELIAARTRVVVVHEVGTTSAVLGRAVPAPPRAGDPPQLIADPSHAHSVLGWTPRSSDLATIVEDALRSRHHRMSVRSTSG